MTLRNRISSTHDPSSSAAKRCFLDKYVISAELVVVRRQAEMISRFVCLDIRMASSAAGGFQQGGIKPEAAMGDKGLSQEWQEISSDDLKQATESGQVPRAVWWKPRPHALAVLRK
jgi:hypothetical protein